MSPLVRVCSCGALTPTPPCPNCRTQNARAKRARPKDKAIWNTTRWRKLRARVLAAADHTCEQCGAEATTVHHADGYTDPWDRTGLTALCSTCHGQQHGGRHPAA